MNKLEELIQELCPNGVKYRTVGDICNICRGVVISKDFIRDNVGAYPVYSSQTENNGELGKINTYSFDGEYLTWTTDGANAGSVFYRNGKFSVTNVCGVLEMKDNNISAKFLFYVLQTSVKPYVNKGMGNPKLMSNVMARVKVPVPPIEVQEEIVRILDKFTEFTAELTAELTARKKQYEFYRDQLLSFNSINDTTNNRTGGGYNHLLNCQVKWVRLGDLALVTKLAGFEFTKYVKYSNSGQIIALRGLNVKNGQLDLTDVKYIDESDLSKLDRSKLKKGDLLFTYVGTVGQVALINEDEKFYLAPNVALIRITNEGVLPDYLRYYCQSNIFYKKEILRLIQASSMQNIPMEKIRKFVVPVPPIEEQKRIVAILDRFDKLCNDISEGLPAEIDARQKQYEYYRDKLLTFEEIAQ